MKLHLRIHRIIIYVIWLVVLVMLYDYFRVAFLMAALIIAALSGAADVLLAYLMAGRTEVKLETDLTSVLKNDTMPVRVHIISHTFIPSSEIKIELRTTDGFFGIDEKTEIVYPLFSKEDFSEKLPVIFQRLGTWRFQIESASVRDFLGFVDMRTLTETSAEVTVFPDAENDAAIDRQPSEDGMSEADESVRRGHDTSDVTDIREYVPGDRPRDIHWKISAKKDELMVKQREAMSDQRLVVLVWCGETVEETEGALTRCYAILNELVSNQVNTELMWWSVAECSFHKRKTVDAGGIDDAFRELYTTPVMTGDDPEELMRSVNPEISRYLMVSPEGETVIGQ